MFLLFPTNIYLGHAQKKKHLSSVAWPNLVPCWTIGMQRNWLDATKSTHLQSGFFDADGLFDGLKKRCSSNAPRIWHFWKCWCQKFVQKFVGSKRHQKREKMATPPMNHLSTSFCLWEYTLPKWGVIRDLDSCGILDWINHIYICKPYISNVQTRAYCCTGSSSRRTRAAPAFWETFRLPANQWFSQRLNRAFVKKPFCVKLKSQKLWKRLNNVNPLQYAPERKETCKRLCAHRFFSPG